MLTLAQVLSRVESSDNPYALRFEPETYQHVGEPRFLKVLASAAFANRCSDDTAKVILASSWGAYQIMGFNLYARAGASCVGVFLGSPDEQLKALSAMLAPWAMAPEEDAGWIVSGADKLTAFATRYNGPGNVSAYSSRLIAAYKALSA